MLERVARVDTESSHSKFSMLERVARVDTEKNIKGHNKYLVSA